MLPAMPIYSVQPVTAPALGRGRGQDPETIVDRLARRGALGPAVSIDSRGRVSATYQVEADDVAGAARLAIWLGQATGLGIAGVTVWTGEADDLDPISPGVDAAAQ